MYRYLAVAWDSTNFPANNMAQQIAQRVARISNDWERTVNADGLMVYHAGRRPGSSDAHVIDCGRGTGVILGTLFCRNANTPSGARVSVLANAMAPEIIDSEGRVLVSQYWGRYVAFLHDKSTRVTSI